MPLQIIVNGDKVYTDVAEIPTPLEVLVQEFILAIRRGVPNNSGLILGAQVVRYLNEFRGLHIS
jgi:hypothetical protein